MSKELGIPDIELKQVQKAVSEAERKTAAREGRPLPEIAGASPWEFTIRVGRTKNDESTKKESGRPAAGGGEDFGGFVKVENPKSPESWVTGILGALNNLEDKATREQKTLESFPEYQAIAAAIGAVPEKMAGTLKTSISNDLGREVYLKEKLELTWAARLRLHNRKTEVVTAGGSLKMLVPSPDVPLGKGVRLEFTPTQPIDLYILVHMDDLFKREAGGATKEICPPVEAAMVEWQKIGESWSESPPPDPLHPDKEQPSLAKKVLNSGQEMRRLRQKIVSRVGSRKAEQLAFDLFTTGNSFDKWDKKLEGLGAYEPRGLIHFDAKRKKEYWERLQKSGPETTIGAYFAETSEDTDNDKELQKERGKALKQADREYAEHVIKTREERLRIIRENRKRAVFTYSVQDKSKGQLVGDLWDALRDEEAKKSFTTLLSEGTSWKNLPWLKLSNTAYSGYFNYALGMASKLEQELTNTTFDPKLLVQPEFWIEKRTLINRLAHFSPSVQEKKDAEQEKKLAEVMRTYCRGVFWTGSHLAQPTGGAAADLDTLGILRPVETVLGYLSIFFPWATIRQGAFTYELVRQGLDAIQTSRVLPREELDKLRREIGGYIYSSAPPQRQ